MSDDATYGLVEPFDIDNGELDGLTPQEIFCLGVEWQMFREHLGRNDGLAFDLMVHEKNVDRIKAMTERHGRKVQVRWVHDDYEGWRWLEVGSED